MLCTTTLLRPLAAAATAFSLIAAVLPSLASAQTPGACEGSCFTHDPAVMRRASDGLYFRFSTLDLISIRTSPSLSGPWTEAGSVIEGRSIIDMDGNDELWAPDVFYMRGLYYCLYSVSTSGSGTSATGYATSETMDAGTWTDHGIIVTSVEGQSPYNAIDGNVVNGTTDDEFWIQWGSYWDGIYQARVSIVGEDMFRSGNEAQVGYQPAGNHALEGPFIYKKDGSWYMFLSVGICCVYNPETDPIEDVYRVIVGRSDSPAGPFLDRDGVDMRDGGGTVVVASHDNVYAPGGQGVFYDEEAGGDILYYHWLDLNVGVDYQDALFGWNVITWTDGWPTLV